MIKKEFPFFLALLGYLWQFFFLISPICIIVYYSFISYDAHGVFFTLKNYHEIFDADHLMIIVRSALLALSTMIFSLLCAYPIAYYLALHVRRWKNVLLFLLTLPFWTNFLILIYAWFFLLERNGIINQILLKLHIISEPLRLFNSVFALFIIMVYCYLPFMIMPLYNGLSKIDRRLFEASADLGATWWQTFSRIIIPLSFSGMKTGLFLVLIPAFGEYAIPSLIGGQKYMLAGSMIRYYFFVVRNNSLGATFTVLCALTLCIIAFCVYFLFGLGITFLYKRGSRRV